MKKIIKNIINDFISDIKSFQDYDETMSDINERIAHRWQYSWINQYSEVSDVEVIAGHIKLSDCSEVNFTTALKEGKIVDIAHDYLVGYTDENIEKRIKDWFMNKRLKE